MDSGPVMTTLDEMPGGRVSWTAAGFCDDVDYAMKLPAYYAALMTGTEADPIALQCVPREAEKDVGQGSHDPLGEDRYCRKPGLYHVYRDRVLLMPTQQCFMNCRHCNRRWKRDGSSADESTVQGWLDYLSTHPVVNDVILTGGDPLMWSDDRLLDLLERLRKLPGERVLRLGTRAPVVAPSRITHRLVEGLRKLHPVYLHTQFNAPAECTPEAGEALDRLADAGVNLGNQMVLLRGVNDRVDPIEKVNQWLVLHRCRPYYLFVTEEVAGTSHFAVSVQEARTLASILRKRLSGIAMPLVVQDQPRGGGKIPVEILR